MAQEGGVIAVYNSHSEAEDGIKQLQKSGFEMKKLSIVGKDYHTEEHPIGYYNTGDRMRYWGKLGAFWGGDVGAALRLGLLLDSRHRTRARGGSPRLCYRGGA